MLKSVTLSLGYNVMCSNCSVSVRFARCAGRNLWIVCFLPPGHGEHMIVLSYHRATDGVPSYGDARAFFPPCVVSWVGSFGRIVCGSLEKQSRTGLRYLLTITLAPTGLVNVLYRCYPRRSAGIAPPPPPFCCWGPGNLSLFYVLITWPTIPRSVSLFYVRWWRRLQAAPIFEGGWPNGSGYTAQTKKIKKNVLAVFILYVGANYGFVWLPEKYR